VPRVPRHDGCLSENWLWIISNALGVAALHWIGSPEINPQGRNPIFSCPKRPRAVPLLRLFLNSGQDDVEVKVLRRGQSALQRGYTRKVLLLTGITRGSSEALAMVGGGGVHPEVGDN
jgi:hypothetical protein